MWPRESTVVLQDLLCRHRCPEISMQYSCGHCQEVQVTLPPVLQRKDGRLNGRAAMQTLKAQCKRCERSRIAGPPTGTDDESALQFRVEIPLSRCAECQRLGRPEEQRGERDSLRCGGVLIELPSVKEKQEDPLPVAVSARQLLQWLQLAPQAKPQRVLLTSARPEPVGGDLACNVVEHVRKVTGWSPFAIALLAWTLGCVAYAFHHAPEGPSVNPDLLYEQFQRRIEDIPVPQSSPQYQQYKQYYLRQYEQHLQEYSALHAQWQQNRPLFNWEALLHSMGVGVLVFAAALAFCEYYYGTISYWMELAEELWYVWHERWSKRSDPLGDSQKMERFLREMGEEEKQAAPVVPQSPAAPSASAKTPTKEERRKPALSEAKGQRSAKAEAAAEESRKPQAHAPEPPPRPVPTPSRASAPLPEARNPPARTTGPVEAAVPKRPQVPEPPQVSQPLQVSPPQVPPPQVTLQQVQPQATPQPAPAQPVPLQQATARHSTASPTPEAPAEPLREPSPECTDECAGVPQRRPHSAVIEVAAAALQQAQRATVPPAALPSTSDAREAAQRQACRPNPDGPGSNVRERLRRKVIERNREQPFKASPVDKDLLREAEELLCQLQEAQLLKQCAEEEERKRATAKKKALRAKLKAADRATKSVESGGDSGEPKQDGHSTGDIADSPGKHGETTAGSEESGRDDSTELGGVPSVEPEEPSSAEAEEEEEAEEALSAGPDEVLHADKEGTEAAEEMQEVRDAPKQGGEGRSWAELASAVEERLCNSPASISCAVGGGLEVVVGKSRRRQRHRAAGAVAVVRARTDLTHKPDRTAPCHSESPAVSQPGKPEPSWNSPTGLHVKNTFIEFPEEAALRPNGHVRTHSAPCSVGRERQDAAEKSEASVEKPAAASSGLRSRKRPEDHHRKAALQVEERLRPQETRPREVKRRPEPRRLGVWDDLPPRTIPATAQDSSAKEKPSQKMGAERKERPSVWDDLPARTQATPNAKQPARRNRVEPPLGPPLSASDGAAAGASILQALRSEQEAPVAPTAAAAAASSGEASTSSRKLRAEAPEFVPALPLMLPAEPQLVPAMLVVGQNQPMMVMPFPLPEGEQFLGVVPMHDPLAQEQGEQVQCASSLPVGQEPAAATGPILGDVTPSPRERSEDVLAQRMEMLRSMLQQQQQLQEDQPAAVEAT